MRTCRTEILVNVNSRRRCNSGNVPLSSSGSSPSLPLYRSAPSFFLSRTYAAIYVPLSPRELSEGNLFADNGNTSQRVSTHSFRSRLASKRETSRTKVYNAGSLDGDTNLVLNGHVRSSISLHRSYSFFFAFSPSSKSRLPLNSTGYTDTGCPDSRHLPLVNIS